MTRRRAGLRVAPAPLLLILLGASLALSACAVARTTAGVVGTAAKTTVKAGGAVIDGAVDVVDKDEDDEDEDED